MACTVKVNRHGLLALRLYWNGAESLEGTRLKDTPKNRKRTQARAELISEEIEQGTFDYIKWFPAGNRAAKLKSQSIAASQPQTVAAYYNDWIDRKKPPFVRPGLHYDYKRQFARYILPKFAEKLIIDVKLSDLEAFRSYLNQEKNLSLKSCRNIIDGTFRAMMRDARKHGIGEKDYFADLEWPRISTPKPDPFTAGERELILGHFKVKRPFYHAFVLTQFWTGMRPSEAIALRWSDARS